MSCQKVRVGRVHVLLLVVLRVIRSTVWLILHKHPHEIVLCCQQILDANRYMQWRWLWVGMWGLPTTAPTSCGSLRDVNRGILSGSSSNHLSYVTHIIRYCNNPIEYDVSHAEAKYNMKYLTIIFTEVTSTFINHPSSHLIYKSYHMTFVQVVEHN
jgi:hypothetical protein